MRAARPGAGRCELRFDAVLGNLLDNVCGGKVATGSAAGIEHFEHPQAIVRPKVAGEGVDEVLPEKARGPIAMRLIDGEHAGGVELRRGECRRDLVGVVGEIVDDGDATGDANGLKAPPHALEAS